MDVVKHIQAEENIKLASMDFGRHCTDTVVYKWYVQKALAAVCQARLPWRQEVFKEDVGASLKPSWTNYVQLCSIHDHSSETSFLFLISFPLIDSDRAVLAEPLIWLPSGGKVKWGQANKAKQKHSVDKERRK